MLNLLNSVTWNAYGFFLPKKRKTSIKINCKILNAFLIWLFPSDCTSATTATNQHRTLVVRRFYGFEDCHHILGSILHSLLNCSMAINDQTRPTSPPICERLNDLSTKHELFRNTGLAQRRYEFPI